MARAEAAAMAVAGVTQWMPRGIRIGCFRQPLMGLREMWPTQGDPPLRLRLQAKAQDGAGL